VRNTVPVLGISIIVLLVVASGCIGNTPSKAGVGNMSNDAVVTPTDTPLTQTGTETMETITSSTAVPVELLTPKVITVLPTGTKSTTTPLGDYCVYGSRNCHLFEQCMDGCIGGGTSHTECAKKICCSSKCMDLPTSDEKVACANECLTGATGTTVPTPVPLESPTSTLAPLVTETRVPLTK
jgi:hypothetical protein